MVGFRPLESSICFVFICSCAALRKVSNAFGVGAPVFGGTTRFGTLVLVAQRIITKSASANSRTPHPIPNLLPVDTLPRSFFICNAFLRRRFLPHPGWLRASHCSRHQSGVD